MTHLATPEKLARWAHPMPVQDYAIPVVMGAVSGVAAVDKFGHNPSVQTGGPEDVWSRGGTWVAPTVARIHTLAGHADDTLLGAGARTVQVWGLQDWESPETSEVVEMNGAGGVNTAAAYVIIHRLEALTFGASETNVGVITATAAGDGTVTAEIAIGKGKTEMAILGIPLGQTLLMGQWSMSWLRGPSAATNSADCEIRVNRRPGEAEGGYVVEHDLGLFGSGTTSVGHRFIPPKTFVGAAVVKAVVAEVSANNTHIAAGFEGYLVNNDY